MEQRFALLLGNNLYDDTTLARLSAPQGDASSLAEVLQDPEIGGFSQVNTMINQPANEIRKSIARFFANRNRDDLLLLYFSGHGVLDERGRLFLATKDTERDLLNATAIDAAFITDAMDRSRSNRQILILDCCHSGAFARGAKGALGASVGTAAAFEGTGSGRVILTATDATQYAWEGEQIIGTAENSVFTRHLVEGLHTGQADRNGDGWIALDEWFDYVYDRVVEETPKQTPGKWSYKQQGEIWIARNPHPVITKSTLPQELLDTIADPRSWVREGAVAELERLLRTGSSSQAKAARAALEELVNDDSRRVSSAAAAILSTGQEQPATEIERTISPLATDQPKAEAPANPIPPTGGGVFADLSPLARVLEPEVENKAREEAVPFSPRKDIFKGAVALLKSPTGMVAILWSLGWIFSLSLALLLDNSYALYAGWAIAGLIADLAVWRANPAARFSPAPLLTLGWPACLMVIGTIYPPLYQIPDSIGSDSGRYAVISLILFLWMILGGLFASLRVLSVSRLSKPGPALLKAALCWGAILLLTLSLSGVQSWQLALYKFKDYSPSALLDHFDGSLVSYLGLGLNGILSGLVGSFLWDLWVRPRS